MQSLGQVLLYSVVVGILTGSAALGAAAQFKGIAAKVVAGAVAGIVNCFLLIYPLMLLGDCLKAWQ